MHPSDEAYALGRAVKLAEDAGEPWYVINDLREMRDEAERAARA